VALMTPSNISKLEITKTVFDCGAVHTRTDGDPYFFTSGWASPIFVDLKRLISYPEARNRLVDLAVEQISATFGENAFDQIAGCELAGVPFSTMVADRFGLPLVVVLKQARGFDRLSQCEGTFDADARTLLVDDLTTDGQTKQGFKTALERAQANVVGIFVFFDYSIFAQSSGILSLINLSDIIEVGESENRFEPSTLEEIKKFAADAPLWSRLHGGVDRL
jgi:orotate phosphoribosyltransferase